MTKEENTMPKLKPCPFCGHVGAHACPDYELEGVDEEETNEFYAVVCDIYNGGCGANSGYADSIPEAMAKWNKRA